ncbi:MAG: hypothetical protein GY727_14325 [Gammaproteobacteria bacterium]|nr:hypothetical protein [Gammaproteobacteria bacterium]MCP4277499.1 hypothetical protein [Gammaproteobacteria bacterium]MCP4831108.1 hypothetical protein [Gammaproteobacteria bacterium]MCP4928532.1 hypothetical protein [Gammaproteobacteria bacterium]
MSGAQKQSFTAMLLWLAAASLAGIMVWQLFSKIVYVSVDSGIYLDSARALLAGARPYIDFVDINPPLAMYLHVPVVWLADILNTDSIAAYFVTVVAFILCSSLVSFYLAKRILPADYRIAAFAIALTLIYSLHNFDSSWFGQREQLFMLALLPYLLLRIARLHDVAVPVYLSIAIGIAAGLMASLKPPQFGAIMVGVELLICLRHRSLRVLIAPEITAAIGVSLAYVALFYFLGGASFDVFVNRYVPLFTSSYNAMNDPDGMVLPTLLRRFGLEVAIVFVGWCATMLLKIPKVLRDLSTLALVVCVMGIVVYIAQAKGFGYHEMPMRFSANLMLCLLCGIVVHKLLLRFRVDTAHMPYMALLCVLFFMAGISATFSSANNAAYRSTQGLVKLIADNSSRGDRVAIFGVTPLWYYPSLVQQDRYSGTRYAFSFMIPMLYDGASVEPDIPHGYKVAGNRIDQEQLYKSEIQEDIEKLKPELVIIYRRDCQWCLPGFSMEEYFLGQAEEFPFLQDYLIDRSNDWYLVLTPKS